MKAERMSILCAFVQFIDYTYQNLGIPRGFLERHPPPVIMDEVQYAPELFPYVKERIDARRDRAGILAYSDDWHHN